MSECNNGPPSILWMCQFLRTLVLVVLARLTECSHGRRSWTLVLARLIWWLIGWRWVQSRAEQACARAHTQGEEEHHGKHRRTDPRCAHAKECSRARHGGEVDTTWTHAPTDGRACCGNANSFDLKVNRWDGDTRAKFWVDVFFCGSASSTDFGRDRGGGEFGNTGTLAADRRASCGGVSSTENKITPQEQFSERFCEQIVDVPVPLCDVFEPLQFQVRAISHEILGKCSDEDSDNEELLTETHEL